MNTLHQVLAGFNNPNLEHPKFFFCKAQNMTKQPEENTNKENFFILKIIQTFIYVRHSVTLTALDRHVKPE